MKKFFYVMFISAFMLLSGITNEGTVKASGYYNTFAVVNNSWGYFDSAGNQVYSTWIYTDAAYYVNDQGRLVYGDYEVDGKVYNFDERGRLTNDWIKFVDGQYQMASGKKFINKQFILGNKKFYYDDQGNLISGLRWIGNDLYYLNGSGSYNTGFQIIDNAWRYLNADGRISTNEFINLSDGTHYVNENGVAAYGLKTIGGSVYYFDNRGIMQTGVLFVDGGWKIFASDGKLAKSSFTTMNGKTYYSNSLGNIMYGLQNVNGSTYYFDGSGAMQTGTLLVNNSWRTFAPNGRMYQNEWFKMGGKTYYAKSSGALSYGNVTIDGQSYQFDNSGALIEKGGFSGTKYYVNGTYVKNDIKTINGNIYYFDGAGNYVTGLHTIYGFTYYFDDSGKAMKDVFLNVGGGWRYFNIYGNMSKNQWEYVNSNVYHTDANGYLMYGWHTIDGVQYYFDATGKKLDMYYGVDISEHNGDINWSAIKNANMTFAIVRASFGDSVAGKQDKKFTKNYADVIANGLKVGVYHYSYSMNTQDAVNEANHLLSVLNGRKVDTPIYFDIEDPSQANLSKAEITAIIDAFCKTIENAGYRAGVYANLNWVNNKIDPWVLQGRELWIAQWNDICTYTGSYSMWQYTSDGYIGGKRFDLNVWYR